MQTFNIHYAKTHLSQLVERAAKGESFVIAKAGKPLVKVTPLEEALARKPQIIGFMKDGLSVPEDFDTMFQKEIEEMFYGSE
jgi:prevent-host-death family protein